MHGIHGPARFRVLSLHRFGIAAEFLSSSERHFENQIVRVEQIALRLTGIAQYFQCLLSFVGVHQVKPIRSVLRDVPRPAETSDLILGESLQSPPRLCPNDLRRRARAECDDRTDRTVRCRLMRLQSRLGLCSVKSSWTVPLLAILCGV